MPKPIAVTDHALVRWIERVGGVDLETFREAIRDDVRNAIEAGAVTVEVAGFRYSLNPRERSVLTVLEAKGRSRTGVHMVKNGI